MYEDIEPPVRASMSEKPPPASQPSWNSMITGVVSGVAVASLTGHWYFAMFSVVTGVVTGGSWAVRLVRARRRSRRWAAAAASADSRFAEECRRYAEMLARRRRDLHPTLEEVCRSIRIGGQWFWQARSLERTSIGSGRRAISVVSGAPTIAYDSIPILIDASPGSVIGVHGQGAHRAVMAMIVRIAAQVGPSDVRISLAGEPSCFDEGLRALPHADSMAVLESRSSGTSEHHSVIVVSDPTLVVRHSSVMNIRASGTTTLIVVALERASLPAVCTEFVDSDNDEVDGIDEATFRDMCREISRWIDPDLGNGSVPPSVDFLDLVDGDAMSVSAIHRRWGERRGRGPCFDLGLGMDGRLHIDLDAEGPHAVVIGTTGSGKSEFLRQIVASMALNGSPEDVAFVLVDYKGGSAFDACSRLCHVVGVITDLDGSLARRVLSGLESELKRREEVLRSFQVRDVLEYQGLLRETSTDRREAMPRLVIVVDELAALRDEVPEFVPMLASIAQRGRSLGLHLVAATQRAAALSADVMANASIRIALRVHGSGDSRDVLGSDRAAFIDHRTPGRMFVRSAGGLEREVQASLVSEVLDEVASVLVDASEGWSLPRRPWSDPLPSILERSCEYGDDVIGLVDDTRFHRHEPWTFILDHHVFISGGSGRTNAIRSIARAVQGSNCREDGLHVDVVAVSCRAGAADFIVDEGNLVDVSDHELLSRLLALCERRIATATRASSTRRSLVLIVDDVDVWRHLTTVDRMSAHLWEAFERVVVSGRVAGITCIMTAAWEGAVPLSIRTRIASHWTGMDQPGVFRIEDRSRSESAIVQMFWTAPAAPNETRSSADVEQALSRLPSLVNRGMNRCAFAIEADSREEITMGSGEVLRVVVIGSRGSGVTTAVNALVGAWSAANVDGRVLDMSRSQDFDSVIECEGTPALLAVDDAHLHSARASIVSRLLGDPTLTGRLSVVAGVSASFLRAHPDHWIHHIRRARTGVILGRVADDCDLLGLHAPPASVHPMTPGRGLWVEGGTAIGVVQFLVANEE